MKKVTFLLLLFMVGQSCQQSGEQDVNSATPPTENWIQLFNGQDLNDWDIKIRNYELNNNFGNTFRVEDGLLKVRQDEYDQFNERFGHIFYKQDFSHYRLRAEYRFVGEQATGGPGWAIKNSGLMLHGQSAASMQKDQDFPISIEVQLLGGVEEGTPRPTANLCTPGTDVEMNGELLGRHCISSDSKTYYGDQWVTVEVLVLGDSMFQHYVNGDTVLTYYKPQILGGNVSGHDEAIKKDSTLLSGGSISLQSESHPIDFRKVELLPLPGNK